MEREIQIINKIIEEAVIHGADSGGSYDQNEEGLLRAINDWLEMKDLSTEYEIVEIPVRRGRWRIYQIIEKD